MMKFEGGEQQPQENHLQAFTTGDELIVVDPEKSIDYTRDIAEQLDNPAVQIYRGSVVTEGLEKYVQEHPEIFRPQHVEVFSRDGEDQQTTSQYIIISDGTLPLPTADVAEQQELPREEQ